MKINERHLMTFANSTARIDKQGYLNKRGELNKSFQKRWFMLKGNLLFYFDKKGDAEPIGVIILEGCSVELAENTDKFSFELTFLGSGARTYVLAAESQEEMEDWMQVLACASYDYMRCAVEELQRQMDELNAANHRKSRRVAPNPPSSSVKSVGQVSNAAQQLALSKRKNPFNPRESGGDPDPVAAVPALALPQMREAFPQMRESKLLTTFIVMHNEFGTYIKQKEAESKKKMT